MKNGGNGAKTECSLATIEASWFEIGAGVGACGARSGPLMLGFVVLGPRLGALGSRLGALGPRL